MPFFLLVAKPLQERFNMMNVMSDVNTMTTQVVDILRTVVAIITVLLIISVGMTLWHSHNGAALEAVKTRLMLIFCGLALIFMAEPFVKFLLGLFKI